MREIPGVVQPFSYFLPKCRKQVIFYFIYGGRGVSDSMGCLSIRTVKNIKDRNARFVMDQTLVRDVMFRMFIKKEAGL